MANKIRIGIIFGGPSKEREISFAGGRTVYDNLNKSLFEAVPIFVDSFGNFIELHWEFIYKGSIRDFYPPVEFLPQDSPFQLYAENLGALDAATQDNLLKGLGRKISVEELKHSIDFAFLCLHGPYGEDGRIQGVFEFYGIPYSGSVRTGYPAIANRYSKLLKAKSASLASSNRPIRAPVLVSVF